MDVIVTGGAGYIGSHVCKSLKAEGHVPIAYDNLSSGHQAMVQWGNFEYGDVLDKPRLKEVLAKYRPAAVIHMAGVIAAGESVDFPYKYYHTNTFGSLTLLEAMREEKCNNIIFSSTAAVYGAAKKLPIGEEETAAPINPYGSSKLMIEWLLRDYFISDAIQFAALRYFNAAGADPDGEAGCLHEMPNNLVPVLMQVQAGIRPVFEIYGTDYPSPDGTAIRDYVHVTDIAEAHVLALGYLIKEKKNLTLNIGTGRGHSVKEVVHCVEKLTGRAVPVETRPRRAGDVAELVADPANAGRVLGWKAKHSHLENIIKTAWNWQLNGYRRHQPRPARA
ncbi:MAG: UDP-glucose 4-epimerase GalE [Pseudomonadota bacterium]|nr:UDP-glucose 4-epimerase GalE [Pseudomonadota bacterium]MDE3037929.1 UDP-glucose 4-epimerase GalE [Pseudomonadota bacterium]